MKQYDNKWSLKGRSGSEHDGFGAWIDDNLIIRRTISSQISKWMDLVVQLVDSINSNGVGWDEGESIN